MLDVLTTLVQIVLPAGLVALGMYSAMRTLLQKEFERKVIEVRSANTAAVLPIRLQAYERVALLLERAAANNLVLRVSNPVYTVIELQQRLVAEIREEYQHNLSQQIYMSDEAWSLTRNAIEETIGLINTSAQDLRPEQPGIELAKAIFQSLIQLPETSTDRALRYVKEEIRSVF